MYSDDKIRKFENSVRMLNLFVLVKFVFAYYNIVCFSLRVNGDLAVSLIVKQEEMYLNLHSGFCRFFYEFLSEVVFFKGKSYVFKLML